MKVIRWGSARASGLICLLGLAGLVLAGAVQADDIRQIALVSNDIAYSPATGRIYASVPGSAGVAGNGNSLTAVDPVTGAVGASVFVGSEPDQLAVSDDGQFVYVALDGQSSVGRFDTAAGAEGLKFSLGSPLSVDDMAVLPGLPHSLAVSKQDRRYSPRTAGTFVYDDGVERPSSSAGNNTITAASATRLYGYNNEISSFDFTTLGVDGTGVTRTGDSGNVITGYGLRIRYDDGLVFGSNATEIDPQAQTVLGVFPGGGGGAPFLPDAKIGRVFFLTGSGGTLTLRAFDTHTFLEVGSVSVPGVSGSPSGLIRWGTNGLAFRTSGGQLFLIRTSLITSAHPLSLALSPAQVGGGAVAAGTLTLAAPAPSGGVTVLLSSSDTAAATVPASLTVAAGQTSATFAVTTQPVTSTTAVTLSAASSGLLLSALLTVQAPAHTHLLWNNADGRVMLWSVAADGSFTFHGFGPYTDGAPQNKWSATAVATGADGVSHLLWNNTDGRVMLWTVDDAGSFTLAGYGPYTDNGANNLWSATAVSVGPDNTVHLLWNNTDHRVMLWNVAPDFSFTLAGFGPYTDASVSGDPGNLWSAAALATGPDGKSRIAWNNADGRVMLWDVDSSFNFTLAGYGPYTDGAPQNKWSVTGASVGPDNLTHLLWANTDRRAMLWDVDSAFGFSLAGYGPYTDNGPSNLWSAAGVVTGPDGLSHLLWGNTDNRAMVWGVDSAFNFTVAGFGPYTDDGPNNPWSVTAVSAGP